MKWLGLFRRGEKTRSVTIKCVGLSNQKCAEKAGKEVNRLRTQGYILISGAFLPEKR